MGSSDDTGDIELLQRIGNGDNDAVTELYNAHVDHLYSLIFNQVDRERETAQEILQETFFAAVMAAGKFRCAVCETGSYYRGNRNGQGIDRENYSCNR